MFDSIANKALAFKMLVLIDCGLCCYNLAENKPSKDKSVSRLSVMFLFLALSACSEGASDKIPTRQISVSLAQTFEGQRFDGRLIVIISKNLEQEPRFNVNSGPHGAQVLGQNVEALSAGQSIVFSDQQMGFPLQHLSDLPLGTYQIQAVLHKYDTFNLATGQTVKLPMDQGEGQQWNRSPGNLFSTPQTVVIGEAFQLNLSLNQRIPPIAAPKDSKYIKHIQIKSELLSQFWGRDMYIGAHVLLPEGFDSHADVRFPLAVFHGHFPEDFAGFRTTAPDPKLECIASSRFNLPCYNLTEQQEAYHFYQQWIGPDFPRMLIIQIQHPTPYYDDSYAVNSASQGPWGDAINYELIPYIEAQFRGIGAGWSRFLYGGSTGGWEAMASQVFYPDLYNGAFIGCPDPIDFRAFTLVDIYKDKNAYYIDGDFKRTARPGSRNWLGQVNWTLADDNLLELVLGDRSRSGGQYDIWEATFSPQGDDGYPVRLWDKQTGVINHAVAEYWRENYDLRYILQRDWATLGPKLQGKLHVYVGDMDNYYLNNAVYLMEDFLEKTSAPFYDGIVEYGDRAEHCWNGDHNNGNGISRLRYNNMYIDKILQRIQKAAPADADLSSWRY